MRKITFLFIGLFACLQIVAQGVKIDFTIKGMRDSVVILGYYNGDKLSVQDSLKLDAKGRTTLQQKEKLPRGKYFLYLTTAKRFDMLLGDDQQFSVVADTSNLLDVKVEGSQENQIFYEYINFIQDKITARKELQDKHSKAKSKAEKDKLASEFSALNESVKTYMDDLTAKHPSLFFSKQLKATFEPEIPENLRNSKDKEAMYRYYRQHYFDNMDFAEAGLARTNTFPKKIDDYISKYIPQVPDSIYPELDMLIKKSRANQDMFKFLIMHLHDYYVKSENLEMENVYVWLLDKYFIPEVTWLEDDFMDRVKEKAVKMKPLLIGKPTPELTMEAYDKELHEIFSVLIRLSREGDDIKKKQEEKKGDATELAKRLNIVNDSITILNKQVSANPNRKFVKIRDVKAKYIILAFWEPECSHCKKSMPVLYKKYKESLKAKNIEVYSACTQLKPHVWGEFLDKHDMYDWINVWDPYNTSKFRDKYDIHSTPNIFILSSDHKILLKKVSVEHLDEAFKYLDSRYNSK